jgi:hypothetical protein
MKDDVTTKQRNWGRIVFTMSESAINTPEMKPDE